MASQFYKTKWCEFYPRRMGCRSGDQCTHAHSWDELRDSDHTWRRFWIVTRDANGWVDWQTAVDDRQLPHSDRPTPTAADGDPRHARQARQRPQRSHVQYSCGDVRVLGQGDINEAPPCTRRTEPAPTPVPPTADILAEEPHLEPTADLLKGDTTTDAATEPAPTSVPPTADLLTCDSTTDPDAAAGPEPMHKTLKSRRRRHTRRRRETKSGTRTQLRQQAESVTLVCQIR
jgi:hypothetical protein